MAKNIETRVKEALAGEGAHEFAKDFLSTLHTSIQKTESRFQKLTLLIFFLAVMFELLIKAAVSEVTFGPFKVSDLTVVQKILPLIIAYLYYELGAFAAMLSFQSKAYGYIVKELHPNFYDNDLELLVTFGLTFGVENILERSTEGLVKKLIGNLTIPLLAVVFFAPFLFVGYAFYQCFSIFGRKDLLVWVSLLVSTILLLQGFLLFWHSDKLASTQPRT